MPSWCQHNAINWVRLHGDGWTVRVLDTVPNSPNHALKWLDPEVLPEAFVKGTMTGPYVGPHSADFLRGATLFAYGGAWMDVGNIVSSPGQGLLGPAGRREQPIYCERCVDVRTVHGDSFCGG
jgi:hypothetical protein